MTSFNELIVIDADSVVIKSRVYVHQAIQKGDSFPIANQVIHVSLESKNQPGIFNNLTDELIGIVLYAVINSFDTSQNGKTKKYDTITQAIDTLVFNGATLDKAVVAINSIEYLIINTLMDIYSGFETLKDNVSCTADFKHNKFLINLKNKKSNRILVNADII
jgi:hypothetical protein